MNAVPLGAEQLPEGVAGRKTHPHPIGAEFLDRRDAKILRLADSHGGAKLTGWGWWGQAGGSWGIDGRLCGLRPGTSIAAG